LAVPSDLASSNAGGAAAACATLSYWRRERNADTDAGEGTCRASLHKMYQSAPCPVVAAN